VVPSGAVGAGPKRLRRGKGRRGKGKLLEGVREKGREGREGRGDSRA